MTNPIPPPNEVGPIVIGAREIYDQVVRMQGTVQLLVIQNGELSSDYKDHENRLRALERSRWPLPALSALVATAALVLAIIQWIGV